MIDLLDPEIIAAKAEGQASVFRITNPQFAKDLDEYAIIIRKLGEQWHAMHFQLTRALLSNSDLKQQIEGNDESLDSQEHIGWWKHTDSHFWEWLSEQRVKPSTVSFLRKSKQRIEQLKALLFATKLDLEEATHYDDISTAPRNGTRILGLNKINDEPYFVWWTDDVYAEQNGSGGRSGWFSGCYEDHWGDMPRMEHPKYWLPIPFHQDSVK